jgi:SAM-dependent methyltransferase
MNSVDTMNGARSLVLDDNVGERMIPEVFGRFAFWEHVYRYAYASRFVNGKRVLDIACGEGYGAAALQKAGATQVIGVDISEAACVHARRKYGIDARPGTAENIPLAARSVDVIVSFETIEHVPDPQRFLDECVRILVPGGRLIISTPNKGVYNRDDQWRNPHHCSEMTEVEFSSALQARFCDIQFSTQHPDYAPWWSARSFISDNSPWRRVRGFGRVRQVLQSAVCPEAVKEPTEAERNSVLELILQVERRPRRFLNPYSLRPRRRWTGEKAIYTVATGIR